jgi:hypothetical protein
VSQAPPEPGLDRSGDPAALVAADLPAVSGLAGHLEALGAALERTARGLRGIEVGEWSGEAADAFRARFDESPHAWFTGADAFADAAGACRRFAGAVGRAREQAGEAVELHRRGVAASEAAVRERDAALQAQDPAVLLGAFVDPGVPMVERAAALLDEARASRDAAGAEAARAVRAAASSAPDPPSGWSRAVAEASDVAADVGRVLPGVGEGVEEIARFVRTVNPVDPWNVTHPASYVDGLSATAAGLVQANLHPSELVKGAVGTGWGSDPGLAAGKLIPGVALSAGTAGSGRIAAAAAERSAARAIRQARPQPNTEDAAALPLRAHMNPQFAGEDRGRAVGFDGRHKVRYFSDRERERHRLTVHDGRLYDARGRAFHSKEGGSVWGGPHEARSIFVLDGKGNLYASNEQAKGRLHHSSFLGGAPVASAGEIGVVNGKVTFLSDRSGHYAPQADCITQAIRYLHDEGVNLDDGILQRWGR